MSEWHPDPQRARRDAMTKTQRPTEASYYHRCEHYRGDEHCKYTAGHPGQHEAVKEKEA